MIDLLNNLNNFTIKNMKNSTSVFSLLICLFLYNFGYSQSKKDTANIFGSWQGILIAEGDSQIVVFDILNSPNFSCNVSFPWIGMEKINASKAIFKNDSILIKVNQPNFSFKGALDINHTSIRGQFKQGKSYPLTVFKTDKPDRINRPQTPLPPFNYSIEEVTFYNKKGKVGLSGTLTVPKGKGPFPAVVLITGSGPQNRDEEILKHKPFLVLADYLTSNGIAVLRYDDRGVGKSTGKFSDATTFDFATDADAAFSYLYKDPRINTNNIGLIGHSEGGLIAQIVANKDKKVQFIILMAGTGVDGKSIMLEQYRLILKTAAIPDSIIAPLVDLNRQAFDIVLSSKSNVLAATEIRNVTESTIHKLGEATATKYNLTKATAEVLIVQLLTPWMKEFLRINPAKYIHKLKIPILALSGTLDLQVPEKQNIFAIQNGINKKNKKNLSIVVFPNLNHLFQTALTGSPSEYARIEETINREVLASILNFIIHHK